MPFDFPIELTPTNFYEEINFTYVNFEFLAKSAAIEVFPVPFSPYNRIEAS